MKGYGRSTEKNFAVPSGISDDIIELAEKLEIEKFSLMGVKSSTPLVLMSAEEIIKKYPQKLHRVGVEKIFFIFLFFLFLFFNFYFF